MKQTTLRDLAKKILSIIMFVNQPIRKKFALFSVGVLFWFVMMYTVSISTLLYINYSSDVIVGRLIPQERTAQKIVRNLHGLNVDALEMLRIDDEKAFLKRFERAKAGLEHTRDYVSTLVEGGRIEDISHESGRLTESYMVAPIRGDPENEKAAGELSGLIKTADAQLDALSAMKLNSISGKAGNDEQPEKKFRELEHTIIQSLVIANDFAHRASLQYRKNSEGIHFSLMCTLITATLVLITATVLLFLFTRWIADSIVRPVNSIIGQIRDLGKGDIDLSKKLEISSHDEIGVLSNEFNGLMESVYGITLFKKIIEEDEGLEDVYSRLGERFRAIFGLGEFMIYEVSNSQNKMRPVYPITLSDKELYCNLDILDNCNLCRAKKTGHRVSSFEYANVCKYFLSETDKDYVCISMIVGGASGGVVQFTFDRSETAHNDMHEIQRKLYRVEQYIREAAPVIEGKRLMNTLRDSSLKDSLTGLYNRRFLQEYTESLVSGILRRGKNIGLIMCDLDYFKQVNDVYGHNTGDMVLKETADVIRRSVRAADLVIRFGGEEFLVVLLDIQENEAVQVAEKIRMNVEETKFKIPDGILKKTISLGISEFPLDTEGFWQAIKYADVALYVAKEQGRNKTVRFTPEMWKDTQF